MSAMRIFIFFMWLAFPAQAATVTEIINGHEVKLDNGQHVRLDGILAPQGNEPYAPESKAALNKFTLNKSVDVAPETPTDPDQRLITDLHIDGQSISRMMIDQGFARAYPNLPLGIELLATENAARDQKRGLWKLAAYQPQTPESAGKILNSYGIVEGSILQTAQIKNRIYLNFGPDWKTDFTIELSKDAAQQIDWQALTGKTIHARGWVEWYFGPKLLITNAGQLEILP